MRKLSFYTLIFFSVLHSAQAQNDGIQTLFGGQGIHSSGGYGGFNTAFSEIDGRNTVFFGGQGGWVINHSFVLGGGGYGFSTALKYDEALDDRYQFEGGYGGLMLEFIINPTHVFHFNFPLLIGGGGVRYAPNNKDYSSFSQEDDAAFFVLQPGAEIQVNLLPFMRVALGARYRFTSNVSLRYADSGQAIVNEAFLRGFSGNISFKFGKF